ncbi:MAG: polyvinyl alcohol dehydrogenase (cytochrome), partial [Candidatus Azotimanducaceae bacterium]
MLDSTSIDKLSLKWVYGLANNTPRSYPLITEETIYVGDGNRGLVALDRETGCERWVFPHEGEISTAVIPTEIAGQPALLFNDRTTGIYAIAADTGTLIWHAEVDEDPLAWYSGTPIIQGNRVYAPISSFEVALAFNPFYGCCTTSGGLAAFDLATGTKVWYLPTIAEAP